MTATYTFDVFSSLDGFAAATGAILCPLLTTYC